MFADVSKQLNVFIFRVKQANFSEIFTTEHDVNCPQTLISGIRPRDPTKLRKF
jgi:hypothetical protein